MTSLKINILKGQNRLLSRITPLDWEKLSPYFDVIDLSAGKILCEPYVKVERVYFPVTSVVSLLHELEDGSTAETAIVGNEGLVGISVFMGGGSTSSTAVVRCSGLAYCINAAVILDVFNHSDSTMQIFLKYTQALITQVSQVSVCNRYHTVEQQLCRWLLLSADRLSGNEINMTHLLIASMLGVRREGVTEAACRLQKAKLIKYARGHITILDRSGLENRACECYQVVKSEYERLLPKNSSGKNIKVESVNCHRSY